MDKKTQKKVRQFKEQLTNLFEIKTSESNQANGKLYETINTVQVKTEPLVAKLAIVSDMLLDLKVLKGNVATKVNLISSKEIYSNKNVTTDGREVAIALSNEKLIVPNNSKCGIRSILPYTLLDKDSQQVTIQNMLNYKQDTTVQFTRVGYNCTIVLSYDSYEYINNLKIDFGSLVTNLPNILSLKYVDIYGNEVQTLMNGTKSIEIDKKLSNTNVYNIDFQTINTKQLLIEFGAYNSDNFTLTSIVSNYNTYSSTGEIVYGPYVTNDPILKASIECNSLTDNVKIEVSPDLSSWYTTQPTTSLNLTNDYKVLSFNTINEKSFKSETDVRQLYVKLIFTIPEATSTSKIYDTYQEDNLSTDPLVLEEDKYTNYLLKNNHKSYGSLRVKPNTNVSEMSLESVEKIYINNTQYLLGTLDTDISVSQKSKLNGNITTSDHLLKVSQEVISTTDKDPVFCKLFDIEIRRKTGEVKSGLCKNACYGLIVPEGIYTVVNGTKQLKIDTTAGFINNSLSSILVVADDSVQIYNELNDLIINIKKEDLKDFVYEDLIYKYIDLVGILYSDIIVTGYTKSLMYPITPLATNEYSLLDNVLHIGTKEDVTVTYNELIKTEIPFTKHLSYKNGNYIKRDKEEYVTYNSDTYVDDAVTVVKLNNVHIKKGSIVFISEDITDTNTYVPNLTPDINFLNIGSPESPVYLATDTNTPEIYLEL